MDLFYAHATIYDCFKLFPDMDTEKVLAFTRLYRRLIIAKQTDSILNGIAIRKNAKINVKENNSFFESRNTLGA